MINSCFNKANKNHGKNDLELIVKYSQHDKDSNQIKLVKNNEIIYNWVTKDNLYLGEIMIYDSKIDSAYFKNPIQINDSTIFINSIFIGNAYLTSISNGKKDYSIDSDYTFMLYLKEEHAIIYFPDSKSDYFEDENQMAPLNLYNLKTKQTSQIKLPFYCISRFNNLCESKEIDKSLLNEIIKRMKNEINGF